VHAISGATGGVTAISTFYPLNTIRMRLQTDDTIKSGSMINVTQQIVEKHGAQALFQGWWSAVVCLGVSNFVYFYTYNAMKVVYQVKRLGSKKISIDPVSNLAIASAAGIVNVYLTTPLWVVNTRLSVQDNPKAGHHGAPPAAASGAGATGAAAGKPETPVKKEAKKQDKQDPYKGVADCLVRIANEEGVASLWKGVGSGLALVSNPAIQFVTYERLREPVSKWAEKRGSAITSLEFFVMGAIAKAVATVLTYPIQVAQSKLRADRGTEGKKQSYNGTWDCLQQIYAKDGIAAWFKGMESKLWQTVLTAAFQFLVYERIHQLVTSILQPGKAVKH